MKILKVIIIVMLVIIGIGAVLVTPQKIGSINDLNQLNQNRFGIFLLLFACKCILDWIKED